MDSLALSSSRWQTLLTHNLGTSPPKLCKTETRAECCKGDLASIGAQVNAVGQTVAQVGLSVGGLGGRKLLESSGDAPPLFLALLGASLVTFKET